MRPDTKICNRKRARLSGFSLVEVMVGTLVVGLIFSSLIPAYTALRRLNFETDSKLRSSLLASSELERLRTLEYAQLEQFVGSPSVTTIDHPTRDNIRYAVSTEINQGVDVLDGMLHAVVTVTWIENQRTHEIVGRAFFAQDGLSDKKFDDAN